MALRLYQLPVPNDQPDRYALRDLVSKGIWFCNDQATPYLIDSCAWVMGIKLCRVTDKRVCSLNHLINIIWELFGICECNILCDICPNIETNEDMS